MTTRAVKFEKWLSWQNSLSGFLFNEDFSKNIVALVAKADKEIELEVINYGKDELLPLDRLKRDASKCLKCRLGQTRDKVVFGEGRVDADIMFIGEGPGEDEDRSGRPFVGKAGQLLTKIIENGMKMQREDVYIANIVKCRPPSNRDPLPDEAAECIGYLKKQIEIVDPKVIVLLGRVAAKHLLSIESSITKARENSYSYHNAKVFITYHPSALLRNESYKRPVWEDIKKILQYLQTV